MATFATPNDWQIGQTIANRYEVRDILGEGGMGKVYKVYCWDWKTEMAVKRPQPSIFTRVLGKEEFVREAETWVKLRKHPHIVSCHFVETIASVPSIFVEYIDGGSLADWIENKESPLYQGDPPVILGRILDLAIQMAWGLDHAHTQGLIHQDIKPANVLLTPQGTAKITDFGLARARFLGGDVNLSRRAGASVVVEGVVGMWTKAYVSPEQVEGKLLKRSTDLWSWAVSVLDLFVGTIGRGYGPASAEALENYLKEGLLPLMPPEVATLLRQCFQPNPVARPASMREIAAALQVCYAERIGVPYPRAVFEQTPTLIGDLGNRANSLLELGKPEEALAAYEDILRLNPQDAIAWRNKGVILHALQRYEVALAACEQALRLNPQHATAWRNKGLTLYELQRYEVALAADEQALRLDPNLIEAWGDKGNTLRELQRYEEALAAYEQTLRLDPQRARTWMDKGVALHDLKRYEEALAAYEQALRLDPLYARTWMNKGVALHDLKRYEEALAAYEQALRLEPTLAEAWGDKGNALRNLKQYEEALGAYAQALHLNPKDAEAWRSKGNILYHLQQVEEALVAYEQALRLNPQDALAWMNKGHAFYNLKRFEEALVAYEQALSLGPQDGLIEVPNKWGEGNGEPLAVELHPNLEQIFTASHPPLPQRVTEENRKYWGKASPEYMLLTLATAYLMHPDPNVRVTTLHLTKNFGFGSPLPQQFVDALADPSEDVRVAAAQLMWDLSPDAKVVNKVTFALGCLRDEIGRFGSLASEAEAGSQGLVVHVTDDASQNEIAEYGFHSTMTPAEAQRGLEVLRSCRPDRRTDFNRWIIYVWCRRNENLAQYGYMLLNIYDEQGSFLGKAEGKTRNIGELVKDEKDRQKIYHGIWQALGDSAALELESVWNWTREPFHSVTTRDVSEAIDAIFNKAINSIPTMMLPEIEDDYKYIKKVWASQALYNGFLTQMRELVSYNLSLLAGRYDFECFKIYTGPEGKPLTGTYVQTYVQVGAFFGRTIAGRGTVIFIRLWKSQRYIHVCGNNDFEEPQKAAYNAEDLVRKHVTRIRKQHSDSIPDSLWDLLIRPDILSFTNQAIARQLSISMKEGKHTSRGQRFSDALVVVSAVPALRPDHAMAYFPGGYVETVVSILNAYKYDLGGSSPFIHWICCFEKHAAMVHLSFLFSRARIAFWALELLSREEKEKFLNPDN